MSDERKLGSSEAAAIVKNWAESELKKYRFDSRKIEQVKNCYVAWIDLMGAGHLMSVSVNKSANSLARLHMAVDHAARNLPDVETLPINDGVFIFSRTKNNAQYAVRDTLIILAGFFIATDDPQNKFMVRGSIAFGPVYRGEDISKGLSQTKQKEHKKTLERVAFGPPIIQSYMSEHHAPPYGIFIHESARAFAPHGDTPFSITHWLWWQNDNKSSAPKGSPDPSSIKDVLCDDLISYFSWMHSSSIFNGVAKEKIDFWDRSCRQYFRRTGINSQRWEITIQRGFLCPWRRRDRRRGCRTHLRPQDLPAPCCWPSAFGMPEYGWAGRVGIANKVALPVDESSLICYGEAHTPNTPPVQDDPEGAWRAPESGPAAPRPDPS